jgi:hypothetical protein
LPANACIASGDDKDLKNLEAIAVNHEKRHCADLARLIYQILFCQFGFGDEVALAQEIAHVDLAICNA